ncbi:MAG TPA: hypothetical protein DCY74_00500 [Clostridiales bacterium]|nr:hypothetical protein [Clostridiales bacterium]
MKKVDYMTPSRNDNGEYSHNYMEHIVKRKPTFRVSLWKALIVLAVIIANLLLLIITVKVPALMIFPWFLSGVFVWWVYRFFNVEYEYVMASGEIDVDMIYGKKQRKRMVSVKINEMELIAPLSDQSASRCSDPSIQKRFTALSSADAPDGYFAIFHHPKHGKSVLFFEVPNKAKNILKYYNSSNFVILK